jgi:hypothetical protein
MLSPELDDLKNPRQKGGNKGVSTFTVLIYKKREYSNSR